MQEKMLFKRNFIMLTASPVIICLTFLILSGCSVVKATKQPNKKDLSVLNPGTYRGHVIAELGEPVWSEERDGGRVDIYKFVQGYSKGAKAGRALFHAAADVYTLGLWEIVGTPTETYFNGKELKVEVIYGGDDRVKTSELLNEDKGSNGDKEEQKEEGEEVVAEEEGEQVVVEYEEYLEEEAELSD